jgi:Glycosyl transferases group 1
MPEKSRQDPPLKRVAMVIAAEVIGGHEFQARALADDLSKLCRLTIYLNREEHRPVFETADVKIKVHPGLFLTKGWLGSQVLRGITRRKGIRALLDHHEYVIVSSGTVEAGVCTSVALARPGKAILYLPFFYDRTVEWFKPFGRVYNVILGSFGLLYKYVITINRIQARLIRGFLHRPTLTVPNLIRDLPKAVGDGPGRVLCICRLDRQKRLPELLGWLNFAESPFREVLIIGDGPEKTNIARLSASLQHIRVKMLGWKSPAEQNELIGARDVLILNSWIEGEPLVIREANLRGIAVLARDIVGVRGITKKGNRFKSETELRQALRTIRKGDPVTAPNGIKRDRLLLRAFEYITETLDSGTVSG